MSVQACTFLFRHLNTNSISAARSWLECSAWLAGQLDGWIWIWMCFRCRMPKSAFNISVHSTTALGARPAKDKWQLRVQNSLKTSIKILKIICRVNVKGVLGANRNSACGSGNQRSTDYEDHYELFQWPLVIKHLKLEKKGPPDK